MASFLTPKQFAAKCGVHYNTVYYWLALNAIPHQKVRINIRFRYHIPLHATPPTLKSGPVSNRKGEISNVRKISNNDWDKIQEMKKILLENQISIEELEVL